MKQVSAGVAPCKHGQFRETFLSFRCEASVIYSRTAVYFCNSQEIHRTSPLSVVSLGLVTLRQSETGTTNFEIIIFNICLGAGSRQYGRYTKSPLGITPLKEIWDSPRKRKFDLGGVSTHDLRIRSSDALPTELRGQ